MSIEVFLFVFAGEGFLADELDLGPTVAVDPDAAGVAAPAGGHVPTRCAAYRTDGTD